jgi:hypothetical protein
MEQPEKRKISKDNSLDLESRARFTFAASAAADAEESGVSTGNDKEGLNSDDLRGYIGEVINEIKKGKNEHLQINKEDDENPN